MPCRLTKNQSPRTRAHFEDCDPCERLERAKGLEPSTPTLARSCSTTELHPHPKALAAKEPRRQRQTYAKCAPRMQQFEDDRNRPNRRDPGPSFGKISQNRVGLGPLTPRGHARFSGTARNA